MIPMEAIDHFLTHYFVYMVTGILFITIGLIVPKFKLYWLIAGLNGRPKKEIEKYNLRYIEQVFGRFMFALGILTIVNPILWTLASNEENIGPAFLIIPLLTVALMFFFGRIKRKRIYNS
jgi:hypothetical protein